jgi:hypothetical protein
MRLGTSNVWYALVVAFAQLVPASAAADDTIFEVMIQNCTVEREAYCKTVSGGVRRLASCLYAHEDKASAKCAVAIYDGMLAFQVTLATLGSYARTCRSDLLKFCGSVKPGEQRLYDCLVQNKGALAKECEALLDLAKPELDKLGLTR